MKRFKVIETEHTEYVYFVDSETELEAMESVRNGDQICDKKYCIYSAIESCEEVEE